MLGTKHNAAAALMKFSRKCKDHITATASLHSGESLIDVTQDFAPTSGNSFVVFVNFERMYSNIVSRVIIHFC